MARVLGIGHALMDIVASIPNASLLEQLHFPKGSMTLVDLETMERTLALLKAQQEIPSPQSGGSAANVIRTLAQLELGTGFIGKVGRDEAGTKVHSSILNQGVTPLLCASPARTGHAIALILPNGEPTFATFLGAAGTLNTQDINSTDFIGYDLLHLEGYIVENRVLMKRVLTRAKEHHLKISLDLSYPYIIDTNREFLHRIIPSYVHTLFMDTHSARAFTGFDTLSALQELSKLTTMVVIKYPNGSLLGCYQGCISRLQTEIEGIDRTGMGDMLVAGVLYGYLQGWSLDHSFALAHTLAQEVVKVYGTHLSPEVWTQVRATYCSN